MKNNELLEAASTPKNKTSNMIRAEFQTILDNAGVMADLLDILSRRIIKSEGQVIQTNIYSVVVPNVKNYEYDADEADISLRLAYRMINRWLAQKEANGQSVISRLYSDVGVDHKFLTRPYRIRAGYTVINVSGFRVSVSIVKKAETITAS
jgi:hypothetical protein